MVSNELDPIHGASPVIVPGGALDCRLQDDDHWHHVKVFPRAWTCQVRWQHDLPDTPALADLHLQKPVMRWGLGKVAYTLHELPHRLFDPPWQRRSRGDWLPFDAMRPPRA